MPEIKSIIKQSGKQSKRTLQPGFLCIELLQGMLILGVLLLLMSAFHVMSVFWQQESIKRFRALDSIESELATFGKSGARKASDIQIVLSSRRVSVTEFAHITHKPIIVQQKNVVASWQDAHGTQRSIKVIS